MSDKDKKWKLVKSKPVFETKWLSIYENDYKLPDGKLAEGYYHLDRPNYVLIVAIDNKKQLVVERNYRRGVDDFVLELPAGWIDENETPKEAAQRELQEETGYKGEAKVIGEIYAQPGFSSMKAYVAFVNIDHALKGEQDMGHDEHIDYELIDISDVQKMIDNNKIKDMGFLSAMQMVQRVL